MPDRLIYLSITDIGTTTNFHLKVDGELVASNQTLTLEQSEAVREFSASFGKLFEQRRPPQLAKDALAALGVQLFEIWLSPFWESLSARVELGDRRVLVVASDRATILNLPWEILRPPSSDAIGVDGKWSIRRLPWTKRELVHAASQLPAGPLRVLYSVSAPTDEVDLDYEREEEFLLRSLGQINRNVVFDSCDLGTFEELDERIGAFMPHIVHLTGHGITRERMAYFAFEDEAGKASPRAADEIGQLFAGRNVQCAFLSACQAGKAPQDSALGGLAQGLINEGVPLVIGWTASILDDVANETARRFYDAVSLPRTFVDLALVKARQAARKLCEQRGDPSWTLPVLYAGSR